MSWSDGGSVSTPPAQEGSHTGKEMLQPRSNSHHLRLQLPGQNEAYSQIMFKESYS